MGAPLGLSNSVTEGIVSTLHHPVRTGGKVDSQSGIGAGLHAGDVVVQVGERTVTDATGSSSPSAAPTPASRSR